jgi:hypothetical protein
MMMAARAMAMVMATKRAMATNRDNTKRGWRASKDSNNCNREGDGTKDMATHTTPGERGVIRVSRDTYARFMVGVID